MLETLKRKGWKTATVGALTVLFSALGGIDWSSLFTGEHGPEIAAAVGAGIVFGRTLNALFRRYLETENANS